MGYVKTNQFYIADNALLIDIVAFIFHKLSDSCLLDVFTKTIHEMRKSGLLRGFYHHAKVNIFDVRNISVNVEEKGVGVRDIPVNASRICNNARGNPIDADTYSVNADRNRILVNKKCLNVRGKCPFVREKMKKK